MRITHIFFALLLAFLSLFATGAFAQQNALTPSNSGVEAGTTHALNVSASLVKDGKIMERGMAWRVFGNTRATDGKFPLIATAKGGSQKFELPSGTYLVHATFGRAGATKKITISDNDLEEIFVLDAGGLSLNAKAGLSDIKAENLRFSIFGIDRDEEGKRTLIVSNVRPDHVVRLKAGIYHVVSTYGRINASVRADLEVNAGGVTKAVMQHRGAQVTLKLVLRKGGDPVANTAWTVLTLDGEKLFESNTVSPSLVLSEGSYEASVRNGNEVYVHNFEVETGRNKVVEVLLKDVPTKGGG